MSHLSIMQSIKDLIHEYDFAKAEFNNLPKEVFWDDPKNLPYEEQVILDGIRFQIMVSKANELYQYINYYNIKRAVSTGVTFTIIGFFLLSLTYYANVNLNLGIRILTELFA